MYAFRFFKIGCDKDKGNDNGGSKGGDDNGGSKGGSIDLSRGGSINDISTGKTPRGGSINDISTGKTPRGGSINDTSTGKTPKHRSMDNTFASRTPSLSRSTSTRAGDPIMFSYSTVRRKPPPIEKTLECTLEDLLHGCVKKIMLTREVLADNGIMVQEEELLRIKVKPGWKEGTKITFEGIGDERPGMLPADVIFSISEIQHPLFKREGNDLVLTLQIPLVKALTGCTLSIPLPGGDKMSCSFNEIIYPGYEKIVAGHGMPIAKEHGLRGNLRIIFDIEFPKRLSDKRRRDVFRILQDGA